MQINDDANKWGEWVTSNANVYFSSCNNMNENKYKMTCMDLYKMLMYAANISIHKYSIGEIMKKRPLKWEMMKLPTLIQKIKRSLLPCQNHSKFTRCRMKCKMRCKMICNLNLVIGFEKLNFHHWAFYKHSRKIRVPFFSCAILIILSIMTLFHSYPWTNFIGTWIAW